MKRFTQLEKRQIAEMVTQGKKDADIAHILGRSANSIACKRIEMFGATRKYKKRRISRPEVTNIPKVSSSLVTNDLTVTQRVLKQLGYKLALIKITEGN